MCARARAPRLESASSMISLLRLISITFLLSVSLARIGEQGLLHQNIVSAVSAACPISTQTRLMGIFSDASSSCYAPLSANGRAVDGDTYAAWTKGTACSDAFCQAISPASNLYALVAQLYLCLHLCAPL